LSSDKHGSASDPAKEAFEQAVLHFSKELTADECKRIWLKDKYTIAKVQHAVEQARSTYEARK
jgi:hypothetical protein